MKPLSHTLTVLLTAASALAVVAGLALLARSGADGTPAPETTTSITAVAREVRTVPEVDEGTRNETVADIGRWLEDFYVRVFAPPLIGLDPTDSPSPGLELKLEGLVSAEALAAIQASPDVFDLRDVVLREGSIGFGGVVVFEAGSPHEALLEVEFNGGNIEAAVHQAGTMLLRRVAEGWLLHGFELGLDVRPIEREDDS